MFPISDTHKRDTFPYINYLIILVNIAVFLIQLIVVDPESFIYRWGFIPKLFDQGNIDSYIRMISSMWLHGGWFHLLSNMWFLHIFGDNIEDRLGHLRYFAFYIFCGICAILAQYIFSYSSLVPMIGASGAISGVTGAYFVLFKHSKIKALVPTFFGFWNIIQLPAWFFLGYWFFIQIFSSIGSFFDMSFASGGIAFFAHIGGFVTGYILALFFKRQ